MQTTLLGLAIALILALLAALVGPYFIDWNQFRPQFEAEASRIIGAPVKVGGALDARLLPTPTLRLRDVSVGGKDNNRDTSYVRASKLDVEFSLGSLMRGEWRADQLSLDGFELALGLDAHGKIVSPLPNGGGFGALSIDRLSLTGRIALHDAASDSTITLDDVAFAGDVRGLAGAAHGDGEARYNGVHYPFHLSSGRSADGSATRLHLGVDPGERPFGFDLDGSFTTTAQVPHLEGTVTLARAIALRSDAPGGSTLQTPWKLTSKIKLAPAKAKLDDLEITYGSDESGLKLAGTADFNFGATRSLRATLSARQFDLDRLLAKENASSETGQLVAALRKRVAAIPMPLLATRLEIGADSVMLHGRPVQNVIAAVHSDGDVWSLDRFEARAPGATQVALNGRLTREQPKNPAGDRTTFKGRLQIDSADPETLLIWTRGQGEPSMRTQKPMRLAGTLSLAANRVALDDATADFDGGAITGRLALSDLPSNRKTDTNADQPSRLEVALKAERLDLDAMSGVARAFTSERTDWPDEGQLALDITHGTLGGQDVSPVTAQIGYAPNSVTLSNLKIGGAGGVAVEGGGTLDPLNASGRLGLTANAASLAQLIAFLAPVTPAIVAKRLTALAQRNATTAPGPAKLKLSVNLDKAAKPDRVNAIASLDVDAPGVRASSHASVNPSLATLRSLDFAALTQGDVNIDARLATDQGRLLVALLGLDDVIAAGEGAAQFEGSVSGVWSAPMRVTAKLSGANLDADAQGTLESGGDKDAPKASLALVARKIDVAPLFDIAPGRVPALTVNLSSRVGIAGSHVTFDDIDVTAAAARVRGRLMVMRGETSEFSGQLGMDFLDLGSVFGIAIGAAGRANDEPLGHGLCHGAHGQIDFQALRGMLPGGTELRPVSGTLKCDGTTLSLVGLTAALGGGEGSADITVTAGKDGAAIDAHAQLTGADGTALTYRGLGMPAGKTALQMALTTRGRAAGALSGALSGDGTLSIENARLNGLDPQAFDAAIAASDAGRLTGDDKLRELVAPALNAGMLNVPSLQIAFSLRDGSLRVASTPLETDSARAVVSGGYDISADQADIRASLTATRIGAGSDHPVIEIFAHGPPDKLQRAVDIAPLSSWLAVRAIDRETKRLDAIEGGAATSQQTQSPSQAQPSRTTSPQPTSPQAPSPALRSSRRVVRPKPAPPANDAPAQAVPPSAPDPSAQSSGTSPSDGVAPLPPPINIKPAPGSARARPRPPLALTPVPN